MARLCGKNHGWHVPLLAILLAISEGLYLMLLRLNAINGVRPVATFLSILGGCFVLYFAAGWALRSSSAGFWAWLIALGGAVLFRVTLLPAGLPPDLSWREKFAAMAADWRGEAVSYERFQLFDDDVWRYLWDGHVAAKGENPFIGAPADATIDSEVNSQPDWETIRDNINYPRVRTIYPPLAQLVFRMAHWLAPGSVLAMKVVVIGFDLVAYGFIILALAARQQPPASSILYGWNPLVIKVFAGSGHIDAVLVAALAATCYFLARKKPTAAAVSLGLGMAAKLGPIVLLPFLARRVGAWRTLAAVLTSIACFVPYLGAGKSLFSGLQAFSAGWQFNSGQFRLIEWALSFVSSQADLLARIVCAALIAAALLVLYRHDDGAPRTFVGVATIALGTVLICSPVVTPWYATWLLPLAVVAGNRVPILFSAEVCVAFLVMVRGTEWPWALLLEYGALSATIAWEIGRNRQKARELN